MLRTIVSNKYIEWQACVLSQAGTTVQYLEDGSGTYVCNIYEMW